jgi:hypothetical protein
MKKQWKNCQMKYQIHVHEHVYVCDEERSMKMK